MEITLIKKKDGKIDRKNGQLVSRLRVVAYARVSTDSDEQKNSYESQKKYYKEKILSNPDWTFVNIYADEAISGTQDFKRTEFMKMIEDGLRNNYDLIITKSISRFARNTVDTLKYVRLLKEQKIAVLFEEENINTLEMSGELLLTILSSVAQQESETISSHVKLGLKIENGKWGAIEIKFGDGEIEDAAKTLLTFKDKVDTDKFGEPEFLMVLTGTTYSYKREDGVYAVSIGSLKN